MIYSDLAKLKVRTYTAGGALPVSAAVVKVYGTDEYNLDVIYSVITDSNGLTSELSLPSPPQELSLEPNAKEKPYAVYNVEIVKEGFYPKKIDNVPLFGRINTMLPISMIPVSYKSNGEIIPQSNLNSVIYENENL